MNDKKIIILMIASTIILLFGGIFFLTKTTSTPEIKTSQNAKAYVADPTSFDWGTIPMSKGNAVKSFTIKNTGTDILKLYNVKTSCHCTKAYVTIDGTDSPSFGMEGLSSWTGEVLKGAEAKLTAVFDPAYQGPQGTGPINRFVSVETNDPANTKLTFTLTGNVVK
ncbi:MAG: DUF1573 domain-containing protein [Patescibacteria group bacterium]